MSRNSGSAPDRALRPDSRASRFAGPGRGNTISSVTRKPAGRDETPDTAAKTTVALDEVSKHIIEQLQEDGRRSYAAIGKAVGLSEAAVRQRVQRLLDSGLVQIVAVTDPLQLGFLRQAMIGVRVSGDAQAVADELAAQPEIEYVVITAGSFDLLVEVVCRDDDQLLEVINERIRSLEAVTGTETFVYLKLRKQTYAWGTR